MTSKYAGATIHVIFLTVLRTSSTGLLSQKAHQKFAMLLFAKSIRFFVRYSVSASPHTHLPLISVFQIVKDDSF
jgi:hypothetical protein